MLRPFFRTLAASIVLGCQREAPPPSDTSSLGGVPATGSFAHVAPIAESLTTSTSLVMAVDSGPPATIRGPVLAAPLDSIDALIALRLAPLAVRTDSVIPMLRADSGSARADSIFFRFREALGASVRDVETSFHRPDFQRTMSAHLLNLAPRRGAPASVSDAALADSMIRLFRRSAVRAFFAEGDVYLEPDDVVLAARMEPFLTTPMRDYLRLETLEQTRPLGHDGAGALSWDEISDRLALADRLLTDHADLLGRGALLEHRGRYLGWYLAGSDNDPTFPRRSGVLQPAVRRSYDRHIEKYGATQSAQVIRDYLALLATTGYRALPSVVAFIKQKTGFEIPPAR